MGREEDIKFLEEFREKVDRYLFSGFAPTTDYSSPRANVRNNDALRAMRSAQEQDPEFKNLRRDINKMKSRAERLLKDCGAYLVVHDYPPLMTGGPVFKFPLFDLITNNQARSPVEKHVFLDRIDQAIGALETGQLPPGQKGFEMSSPAIDLGFVFIAMPMDADDKALEDVHETIKQAVSEAGLTAERVDDKESNEPITPRILDAIARAQFVVADLTHSKPSVYFEAGYSEALGKTPIYVARRGTKLEFDVKDYPVIFFENMKQLREGLKKRLEEFTNRDVSN